MSLRAMLPYILDLLIWVAGHPETAVPALIAAAGTIGVAVVGAISAILVSIIKGGVDLVIAYINRANGKSDFPPNKLKKSPLR